VHGPFQRQGERVGLGARASRSEIEVSSGRLRVSPSGLRAGPSRVRVKRYELRSTHNQIGVSEALRGMITG